jgi:hypothetical protein
MSCTVSLFSKILARSRLFAEAFQDVRALIKEQQLKDGTERLFTIICTYTMTTTLFWAERPTVAVLVCVGEGGMQRAALCSYDQKMQTYGRETVVMRKTMVLERIFRVDLF